MVIPRLAKCTFIAVAAVVLAAACFGGEGDGTVPSPTPSVRVSPSLTPTPTATQTPLPAATGTPAPASKPGTFGQTGPLRASRHLHTATLLEDGRVLIAGGASIYLGVLDSSELYGPSGTIVATQGPSDPDPPRLLTGAFEETGSLLEARQTHAATRLADGRVLVTGGVAPGLHLDSAEIYDPATGAFSSAGAMTTTRLAHGSTLLDDGRVLIVGGFGSPSLTSTEIYDPETGSFAASGKTHIGREFPSLVHLGGGRVLVHGGAGLAPEIYDPSSGSFTLVDTPPGFRWPSQATGLLDGTVLLTGDCCAEDGVTTLGTAAILDPVTGEVETIEAMHDGRAGHTTVRLADGRVLLAGGLKDAGHGFGERLGSAEVYHPATRSFELVAPMSDGRQWHTLTLLPDGRVLVVGSTGEPYVRAAEVFGG